MKKDPEEAGYSLIEELMAVFEDKYVDRLTYIAAMEIAGLGEKVTSLTDALASITRERDAMRAVRESEWRDKADEHTTAINAAHPTNTTDPVRWDRYSQALAMVGNRHGKYALVDLVNWLLTTRAALVNGEGGE